MTPQATIPGIPHGLSGRISRWLTPDLLMLAVVLVVSLAAAGQADSLVWPGIGLLGVVMGWLILSHRDERNRREALEREFRERCAVLETQVVNFPTDAVVNQRIMESRHKLANDVTPKLLALDERLTMLDRAFLEHRARAEGGAG